MMDEGQGVAGAEQTYTRFPRGHNNVGNEAAARTRVPDKEGQLPVPRDEERSLQNCICVVE